jgi:hypothetical protein
MKLLREVYKTFEGARKRAAFENAIAKSEYERGYKARFYRYTVVEGGGNIYRVARQWHWTEVVLPVRDRHENL